MNEIIPLSTPPPDLIETPRLNLRKPLVTDALSVYATYSRDPEVSRYLLWRADQTLDKIEEFLTRALQSWERCTVATWAIILREHNSLIGMIDLRLEGEANIGYVLARPYWNRGLMTEAVQAIVDWALSQEHIHRVWAVCEVHNTASARVLEKVGFRREATLERWMVFPNLGEAPRDCHRYGITKEEKGE
jgi:ribosomal-protein-alanine N-acetyltransferase